MLIPESVNGLLGILHWDFLFWGTVVCCCPCWGGGGVCVYASVLLLLGLILRHQMKVALQQH